MRLAQKLELVPDGVLVGGEVLLLGRGAGVHQHQPRAGPRGDVGDSRVEQAARVVDQRCPGVDGGRDRLRTPGVYRDQHAGGAERLHHWAELLDLLVHGDRGRVGATREHADVDDPGAGADEVEAALNLLLSTALEAATESATESRPMLRMPISSGSPARRSSVVAGSRSCTRRCAGLRGHYEFGIVSER